MSLTATVENDTIRLPHGFHLPDGTRVKIMTADEAVRPAPAADDPLSRLGENPVDDLLTDGARRHDAYLEP